MPSRHVRSIAPDDLQAYYADRDVRCRLREYCGASAGMPPSAAYVAILCSDDGPHMTWERARQVPTDTFTEHLSLGGDLSRSLWDTRNLLFVLDLDYQNIDAPATPFLHPADTFLKLEPVYRATRQLLARVGLSPFMLMTGRGYHFVGRIPLEHPVIDTLASLVTETPGWLDRYRQRHSTSAATIDARQARAASGLGLVVEYLAHLVLIRSAARSPIPVVVNGTVVGFGPIGRECVSLDFSYAGDPLDTRSIRMAFSTYQWHRFRPDIFGPECDSVGTLFALPAGRRGLASMLLSGRTLQAARRLARHSSARLPDVAEGVRRLVDAYGVSSLAVFHRDFHDRRRNSPKRPRFDTRALLPCVAVGLNKPNDLLLKPEHLQHLTRSLLSNGWNARQIAELVCELYESDRGWGDRWNVMHPRTRAEFDVRVFAGLVVTGVDRMIDFNCVSTQEKDICPGVGCPHDLRTDRNTLLARVHS